MKIFDVNKILRYFRPNSVIVWLIFVIFILSISFLIFVDNISSKNRDFFLRDYVSYEKNISSTRFIVNKAFIDFVKLNSFDFRQKTNIEIFEYIKELRLPSIRYINNVLERTNLPPYLFENGDPLFVGERFESIRANLLADSSRLQDRIDDLRNAEGIEAVTRGLTEIRETSRRFLDDLRTFNDIDSQINSLHLVSIRNSFVEEHKTVRLIANLLAYLVAAIAVVTVMMLFAVVRSERELRAAHDKLEDRVQQRTMDLRESNRRLVEEIKERERTEEMLRHAQRLEAIGQLTGGLPMISIISFRSSEPMSIFCAASWVTIRRPRSS